MSGASVTDKLQTLQNNPTNIRNICILAHVDHGKTTLADSLIASNGIISQRQAGKLRYMDSREDEQQRGITMKSSAISLQYTRGQDTYLINLIDSPGHVDFSSEVSTAVRLCDGALVIVDAVEGVCPQTHVVLQQAWVEGIKPCLVINKIDRLITELKFSPTEAYYHLQQILEQVNAITGSLFTSDVLQTAASKVEEEVERGKSSEEEEVIYDWSAGLEDTDDSSIYFAPERGNVIFTSALDGWGFAVGHFAELYAKKLGIRVEVLNKTLWGDFFLNTKTKRIYKGAQTKGKKPLFVQFVLDNMWAVYEAVLSKDKDYIDKIVKSMNLKISARDSRHTDPKVLLFALCTQWLPLSKAVLGMTVDHLPSPLQLSRERVERLMSSSARTFESFPKQTWSLAEDFLACKPDSSAPTIAFVSKLFVVDSAQLSQHQTSCRPPLTEDARPLSEEEIRERRELARQRHMAQTTPTTQDESSTTRGITTLEGSEDAALSEGEKVVKSGPIFVAFSRLFSGTISRGQRLYILKPRYDPREINLDVTTLQDNLPEHVSTFTVGDLYILMGREVVPVNQVPAGNVLGIAGLEDHILKSGTVSSSLACPAFRPMSFAAAPILRVAIEPVHASDIPALVQGMKLLNQADPSVEVSVQESGEHILSTAGEVHLKKCLRDLKTDYARVELNVSAPIVPFRETVVHPPKVDMVNEAISDENEIRLVTNPLSKDANGEDSRVVTIQTANRACTLKLQAVPLPEEVTKLLEDDASLLRALNLLNTRTSRDIQLNEATMTQLRELKTKLHSAFSSLPPDVVFDWNTAVDCAWSLGPRHTGPNILLNGITDYARGSVWSVLESGPQRQLQQQQQLRDYDNSIVNGFQLATLAGPLCEEPMYGTCFILREWSMIREEGKMERDVGREGEKIEKEDTKEGLTSTVTTQDTPASIPEAAATQPPVTLQAAAGIYGPFSGQLISAMKEGCRRAVLVQPARLMTAMYTCEILATADVLGKLYGVLGKRNGKIISEEMKEGSSAFIVQALIPVAESFGFAEELRKKTSGLASPQLVFSHWEVVPHDPFWVPSTEEELLHFGEKADADNIARKYMNSVRKRKGLHVDEKIVEHAEKQRTHKKNK